MKVTSKLPISKKNKLARLDWAKNYMKCNFDDVLFTDECRASLDGPDAFGRGWLVDGGIRPRRFKRQQGGGGVMFWAGIINSTLLGPFFVEEGVKINFKNYVDFFASPFYSMVQQKIKDIQEHDDIQSS